MPHQLCRIRRAEIVLSLFKQIHRCGEGPRLATLGTGWDGQDAVKVPEAKEQDSVTQRITEGGVS